MKYNSETFIDLRRNLVLGLTLIIMSIIKPNDMPSTSSEPITSSFSFSLPFPLIPTLSYTLLYSYKKSVEQRYRGWNRDVHLLVK
jgi:hypothetical protein